MKQKKQKKSSEKQNDDSFTLIGITVILLVYVIFSFYLNSYYFLPPPTTVQDCTSIPNSFNRGLCISKLVYSLHDSSICDTFSTIEEKDICFASSASDQMRNQDLCHKISSLKLRDSCFCTVAWNKYDKSLCKFIEDKNSCIIPPGFTHPESISFCIK